VTTVLPGCLSFDELADYWTADLPAEQLAKIEDHVFGCEACGRRLAEAEDLRQGMLALARGGAFQATVTEAFLNRLAREGVHVRTYALEPGETVACSVWDDDEVVITRLRGDFTGMSGVDVDMRLDSGEEVGRAVDLPVRDGATELVLAMPSVMLRERPHIPMRLTLRAPASAGGRVLGEYVFDHGSPVRE
jgi:hypothetical protein